MEEKEKKEKTLNFDKNEYLKWIEDEFVQNLCIMYKQKNPTRGKKKTTSVKTPFQDDMTILKQFGFISGDFRRGLGLQINWPFIHESMNTDNIQ